MELIQEITVSHGLRKEIMEVLQCSYPTIRAALKFQSNTLLADHIRQYAIQHGGVLLAGARSL